MKTKIAISIGDLNGIGIEILLKAHKKISKFCTPYYFIHENLYHRACKKLNLKTKKLRLVSFENAKDISLKKDKKSHLLSFYSPLISKVNSNFNIQAGKIDAKSGMYSFLSFQAACNFVNSDLAHGLVTLPIHKKAWQLADLNFKGHTDALRAFYKKNAIMMLGCEKLYVGLFSEHIPLKEVSSCIEFKQLSHFLCDFYLQTRFKKIGVLGFNPHAGDYGAIGGKEEIIITKAIKFSNAYLNFLFSPKEEQSNFLKTYKIDLKPKFELFLENKKLRQELCKKFTKKEFFIPYPLVSDTAFTKNSLKRCNRLVCMYHDLALAPLKALYFENSVNISLNLPIIRTSVDHGTAFDIAYKNKKINIQSYIQAVKSAVKFAKLKKKNYIMEN
ncbi:4-hydroxythreonine-4-phosphate dehydrogenase [Campylobacter sp. US33a]|uniref:4-hydroxythreonine-4-phosphate dehydrogenase n=1 Tax=Campylobacter sp. US33a TaxID=2498120 RepID=UPI0010687C03|nr:4-hydroxythreonine-4-phosphate dehydrogenase [Campylobacter sp. US33a]TEY03519.1 4-hydroxythreonine-4-phosphate dehydrogenase [Campylobacter sp. US33a]